MLPFLAALLLAPDPVSATGYSRFITRQDGKMEMQTAAQRLVADGKPVIWLIGAVHIGTRPYYTSIQRMLNYQDKVFYEGVRQSEKSPSFAQMPKTVKAQTDGIYTTFSKALGLDFQLNDIDYSSPAWTNVDLTMDDLVKLNATESGGKPSQFDQIRNVITPGSAAVKQFSDMVGTATPGMKEGIKIAMVKSASADAMSHLDPATGRIIVTARNKAVTDALATALTEPNPPHSIGIFYGAAHMLDLQKTLMTQYGYHLDEKRWFASADADPKKLDVMGKTIVDMIDNMLSGKNPNFNPFSPPKGGS